MYIPCYAFFKSFKIDNIKIGSFKSSKIENATSKNLNDEEQGLSENEEFDSLKCYIPPTINFFFFSIFESCYYLTTFCQKIFQITTMMKNDQKCRF